MEFYRFELTSHCSEGTISVSQNCFYAGGGEGGFWGGGVIVCLLTKNFTCIEIRSLYYLGFVIVHGWKRPQRLFVLVLSISEVSSFPVI